MTAAQPVFQNTELGDCLCWDSKTGDWCEGNQCGDYIRSVIPAAIPGLLCLSLLMVVGIMYVCSRLVACCICCAKGMRKEETKTSPGHFKVVAAMLTLMIGMAAVATVYKAQSVRPGVDGLGNVMSNLVSPVTDAMNNAEAAAAAVSLTVALKPNSAEAELAVHACEKVKSWIDAIMDWKDGAKETVGLPVDFVVWAAVLGGASVLLTSGRHRILPELNTLLLFLTVFVLSSTQVLFGLSANVIPDICTDYTAVRETSMAIIRSKVPCGPTGPAASLTASTMAMQTLFVHQSCSENFRNNSIHYACSNFFVCQPCDTLGTLKESFHNAVIDEGKVKERDWASCGSDCTVRRCVTECRQGSRVQAASVLALETFVTATKGLKTMDEAIPQATCEVYDDMLKRPVSYETLCQSESGFRPTLGPYAGLTASVCIISSVMFMLAAAASYWYRKSEGGYATLDSVSVNSGDVPVVATIQSDAPAAPVEGKPVLDGNQASGGAPRTYGTVNSNTD